MRCEDRLLLGSGQDCPRCAEEQAGRRDQRRVVVAAVVGPVVLPAPRPAVVVPAPEPDSAVATAVADDSDQEEVVLKELSEEVAVEEMQRFERAVRAVSS